MVAFYCGVSCWEDRSVSVTMYDRQGDGDASVPGNRQVFRSGDKRSPSQILSYHIPRPHRWPTASSFCSAGFSLEATLVAFLDRDTLLSGFDYLCRWIFPSMWVLKHLVCPCDLVRLRHLDYSYTAQGADRSISCTCMDGAIQHTQRDSLARPLPFIHEPIPDRESQSVCDFHPS